MTPRISVVIPTLNCASDLERLLRSVEKQTEPPDETIVVDGGSLDSTVDVASKHGSRIIDDRGAGDRRSAAKNRGAREALGSAVLFLDADMELTPRVLGESREFLKAGHFAVVFRETSIGTGTLGMMRQWERALVQTSDFLVFARLIQRDLFLRLGGFDENMSGFEDLDVEAKLLEAGIRPARGESMIYHHEEDIDWIRYLRKQSAYNKSRRIYADKHPSTSPSLLSPVRRVSLYVSGIEGPTDVVLFILALSARAMSTVAPAPREYSGASGG